MIDFTDVNINKNLVDAIEEEFRKKVESNVGCALMIAGSNSDKEHLDKIILALESYKIPYNLRICSAHKQPEELKSMIDLYNSYQGNLAIIAVAGNTDALSGTVSYHSNHPVISCPPQGPDEINQSCLTNPAGSSNAYIMLPKNAARFIAQMFSSNPEYSAILYAERAKKNKELSECDKAARILVDLREKNREKGDQNRKR